MLRETPAPEDDESQRALRQAIVGGTGVQVMVAGLIQVRGSTGTCGSQSIS